MSMNCACTYKDGKVVDLCGAHWAWVRDAEQAAKISNANTPIKMLLFCPGCAARHIDTGDFETKVHHTHACQECGMVWRPAVLPTVGVQFLPGFKQ